MFGLLVLAEIRISIPDYYFSPDCSPTVRFYMRFFIPHSDSPICHTMVHRLNSFCFYFLATGIPKSLVSLKSSQSDVSQPSTVSPKRAYSHRKTPPGSAVKTIFIKSKRKLRCRKCEACLRPDCGKCVFCK